MKKTKTLSFREFSKLNESEETVDALLIRNLENLVYEESDRNEEYTEYIVLGDTMNVKYWNSSNKQAIKDREMVHGGIIEYLQDGVNDGTVSDGWNEIMFESVYN